MTKRKCKHETDNGVCVLCGAIDAEFEVTR